MRIFIKILLPMTLFLMPPLYAWQGLNLWQTPDQQALKLLQIGQAKKASQIFKNKDWQAVSNYRAEDYSEAFSYFSHKNTSDSQYNAGNSAAYLGKYKEAIEAYDKAIALNSNNTDAVTNRDIVKQLLEKKEQQAKNTTSSKSEKNKNKNKNKDKNTASGENNNSQQNSDGVNKQNTQNNQGVRSSNPPVNENLTSANASLIQENEEKKQLLRRLMEDEGGLLRQKFMRDYFRRHALQ